MAGKKTDDTPKTDAEAPEAPEAPQVDTHEAEAVTVSAPDTPETVDAEIVDETGTDDRVETETVHRDDASDAAPGTHAEGKPAKKGGGGFVAALILLLLVLAVLAYLFRGELGFGDDDAPDEDAPGVVVTEDAEPFPGNELNPDVRRPIRAEAAPGTRQAARDADAAREADEGADDGDADDEGDVPVALAERAEPRSALAERAAARNRARREAREARAAAPASEDEPSEDGSREGAQEGSQDARAVAAAPRTGFVDPQDDSEMAEAVRRARAEQERIRREDEARMRRAEAAETDAPEPPARAEAEDRASDDPNALPGFTARDEDASGERPATVRERMAQTPSAETPPAPTRTRPTGRVRPLTGQPADDADEDGAEGGAREADRPQPVRPRPPVIAASRPDDVAAGEALEARLDAVEADLRDALRQDLSEEVRQDVLAEASERIEAAIQQTERQVDGLRAQLTEQEQRSDQRIARLQDRIEVLQSREATESTRGVLILALSNLRGELDAGRPFVRQLDDVELVAPNMDSLRGVRRFAETGLPTDADLRARFRNAARDAAAAEAREGSDGFFAKMAANIKGLFTVREIGEPEGETTSAVVSRAETALARGEVDRAVRELETLDGPAADAFEGFIADAKAKAELRTRIDDLQRALDEASRAPARQRG